MNKDNVIGFKKPEQFIDDLPLMCLGKNALLIPKTIEITKRFHDFHLF